MDMLIKGMVMPTDDVLRLEIYPDGQVRRIVGWAISEKRDAKAIALPEHGRLIDADALIEQESPRGISDAMWKESHFYKVLNNAPTIVEDSK